MDSTSNQKKLSENPLLRPDHELPVPHDMLIEAEEKDGISVGTETANQKPKNEKKRSFPLWIFPVIALGIVVIAGVIYLLKPANKAQVATLPNPTVTVSPTPVDPMSNWQTYQNPVQAYSIQYPPSWYFGLSDTGDVCLGSDQRFIDFYCYNQTAIDPPTTGFKTLFVGLDTTVSIPRNSTSGAVLKLPMRRGETLPMLEESFLTINNIPAYRVVRQLETGTTLRTDVEYTYFAENKLYRLFFEVDDENPQIFIKEFDTVAKTFKVINPTPSSSAEIPSDDSFVACTMDAKICPDGSSVGRTGPKCEFAACPTN